MSGPSPVTPNECGSRQTIRPRVASQRLWRFLPRFYLPTELAEPGPSIPWAWLSNTFNSRRLIYAFALISSTSSPRLWSSLTRTLKDSGSPGSRNGSPLTIALYIRERPGTSSDFSQELLQGRGGAVGLERPDFHLAQPLTAELGFPAQRLLRDQRVGPDGPGMDLVVHQMVQLHRVHVAHCDGTVEHLTGAAVVQDALPGLRQLGLLQQRLDLSFGRPFEHRARHPQPQGFGGPAEVGLEDLSDVHAGRDAQGVEHHFHRRAVRQIGHVLLR